MSVVAAVFCGWLIKADPTVIKLWKLRQKRSHFDSKIKPKKKVLFFSCLLSKFGLSNDFIVFGLSLQNMQELLTRQQRSKYYQQVKDKKYPRVCKSDAALDQELEKQVDKLQTLHAIVDRLNKDFPHAQPALYRATLMLESRSLPTDD